jgi:hypothetical protein
MRSSLPILLAALMLAGACVAHAAGSEADFKTAYAAAEAANKEAGALRNQWTTTAKALKTAKAAADSGDFAKAIAESKHAEELAKASIAQTHHEEGAWKDMEIR